MEDCGYTSVWDEFRGELKELFGLPAFPLLHTASWLCRQEYGWDFREASALEQVKKCTLPMLFIHGDADTFVPTWMAYPLYEAKPEPDVYKRQMLGYSLKPDDLVSRSRNIAASYDFMYERYPELHPWVDSLMTAGVLKDFYIENDRGETLHALYVAAAHPTLKTAVIVHGYTDNAVRMLMIGRCV